MSPDRARISGTHTSRKRVFGTIEMARVTFNRDSWKMLAVRNSRGFRKGTQQSFGRFVYLLLGG
jgi:hypothetical protein